MVGAQMAGPQRLHRRREPEAITDQSANVLQYDRVMTTKLVLTYACGLMVAHRASAQSGGRAIDLACGPGHFTLCLGRHLGFSQVTGVDLSLPMIEVAGRNAARQGLQDRVAFCHADVTSLDGIDDDAYQLSSMTNASHHMPDLATVRRVLHQMDRVTAPDGVVMLMDLVRLRTEKLTECYVGTLGSDYVERGLPDFLEDFRNSMYAAWTPGELREAIPAGSARLWRHIVPFGLPTVQILLGLPIGRKQTFVRSGLPWTKGECPVPRSMLGEWRMLRLSLSLSASRKIAPGSAS